MNSVHFWELVKGSPFQINPNLSQSDQALLTTHRREAMLQTTCSLFLSDLTAEMISSLASDAILYPLETIVVRLCVQGTRTLVDNLDTGDSVIPIISSFDGVFDVLRSAATSPSGFVGLYRGFGALVLQYAFHVAFLFGIKYAYEHILYMYSTNIPLVHQSQPPPPPYQQPVTRRLSIPSAGDYDFSHSSYGQPPFSASTAPRMFDNQPGPSSVWQPNLDSEKWRSSDLNLNPGGGDSGQNTLRSNAFSFRGFNPDTF